MLRFDAPSLVLAFALLILVVTAVLCLLNWSRRRGWGVAFLELLRFVTVALILFTLCKPEYDTELPQKEDQQIALLLLADRSDSMTTDDFVFDETSEPVTRAHALEARLGLLGALTRQGETGEEVLVVFKPSPAATVGLEPGDFITRITVAEMRDESRDRTLPEFDHRLGTKNGARPLVDLLRENTTDLQGREAELSIISEGASETQTVKLNTLDAVLEAALRAKDIDARVYLEDFAVPDRNASSPELQGTDINRAILTHTERYENLAALLLFSDGDDNLGEPPTEEASRALRDAGIAAHTATNTGSTRFPPDVEMVLDDIPTKGVIDDRLVIQYHVYNHMELEISTNVTLWLTNKITGSARRIESEPVTVPRLGKGSGRFFWEAPGEGNFTLLVDLPLTGGELHKTNNFREFSIEIQRETNNVLIIDTRPRWEYRYLRNALQRDRDVKLSVLLIHPGSDMRRGAGAGYIQQFPPLKREDDTPDEDMTLSEFDVIFIGDVGLSPGEITPAQANALRDMVRYQSAGIVFMPGPRGRQLSFYNEFKKHNTSDGETIHDIADLYQVAPRTLSYANPEVDWDALEEGTQVDIPHPLADLIPVAYDTKLPTGNWTGIASDDTLEVPEARFTLMPEGRDSPLLLLAHREESVTNEELWRNVLPGFFWHAGVLRSVPGSRVLAVHDSKRHPRYGYLPLIVTQPVGNGQALFMGTDSAWRWRRFVGADYHYRYWSQVVRWMGHRRKQAVGTGMRLLFGTERPSMGDTLQIEATINDWTGVDDNERVEATLTLPNNATQPIEFERVDAGSDSTVASGVYRATVKLEFAGTHTVQASTLEAPREVTKAFGVERRLTEIVGRPIDAALLAQLSRDTRGVTMPLNDLTAMLNRISEKKRHKPEVEIYALWADWRWGALILVLLALYWTVRKALGLI